jgi:iron-sulfur cluster assembly accessory protein
MVNITDIATEKGKQILTAEGKSQGGLRIYMSGGGCCGPSFGMDINEEPVEGDQVIEKNGLRVFMDTAASEKLKGMEIHFVEEGDNQGFVIRSTQPSSCDPSSGCSTCK